LFKNFDRTISLEDIQKKVADFYHIKLTDMSAARRSRDVARPRQIAMYLCKTLTSKSYPEIGKAFGGRDHTTVMHAVRQVESLKAEDPALAEDLRLLESMLSQ
jgi:chromosomal replication initiator protein